jgi:acetyl esterase/lipase
MALSYDPDVLAAMAPLIAAAAAVEPAPAGDWRTRRERTDALVLGLAAARPGPQDVLVTEHEALAPDGVAIGVRHYVKEGTSPSSALLYLHGGGMFCCSLDTHDPLCRAYASEAGVAVIAPDYRMAPEHPHPTPVEDCYAALVWLAGHAGDLGIDPAQVAVGGDSAGGGLAAGVALLARDRGGPSLALQLLVYPMLDDRTTTPDPEIAALTTWTYDDNITGWGALLDGAQADAYAAPARAADLAGLPPAYLEVGQLDIFRDEVLDYAARLSRAGVPVQLHLYPGVPHGVDVFAPDTESAQRALAERLRTLRAYQQIAR